MLKRDRVPAIKKNMALLWDEFLCLYTPVTLKTHYSMIELKKSKISTFLTLFTHPLL